MKPLSRQQGDFLAGLGDGVKPYDAPYAYRAPILNTEQAAQLLYLHPDTVRKLARQGVLPSCKIGKTWLFVESLLVELVIRLGVAHPALVTVFINTEARKFHELHQKPHQRLLRGLFAHVGDVDSEAKPVNMRD